MSDADITDDIKGRLEDNEAGALTYSLGFITGIIFYYIYAENDFVTFHAVQSMIVFGGLVMLSFILNISISTFAFIPVFGALVSVVLGLILQAIGIIALVLWIVLMYKAYSGEEFKLPVAGDIASDY